MSQVGFYFDQTRCIGCYTCAVACKDWLTNQVDRCVGGKVAKQQCAGPLQLPLNDVGVMALDYSGHKGLATSIGHAPASGCGLSAEIPVFGRQELNRSIRNPMGEP